LGVHYAWEKYEIDITFFVGKQEGERQFSRTRLTLDDNIKMDRKEIG
jgi:hypothetical protein